ncbi:MAG: OmpA family protein [Treponema sp.]|jgi:outer membrane protein OmpA-like peptidoglycan-associated protein|nr:OmpA family protein [Treponema sp.]
MKGTPSGFALLFSFIIFHFSFVAQFLPAQSTAAELESLLSADTVTYAQAARFLLEASDTLITRDAQEAFSYAMDQGWLPRNASPDDAARLDGVSLLLMQSFGIKGGIMYSRIRNPHYAYRELAYKNIILGRSDPSMNITGGRLLFITSRILTWQEEEAAKRELAQSAIKEIMLLHETLAAEIGAILDKQRLSNVSVEATREGVMIRLSDIQFLPDSTELAESEKEKLREVANIIKTIPGRIQVAGHTAMAGTARGRLVLSRERAQAVASYLISLGARPSSQVTVVGYGADVPIADNETTEGMAANRRVEIIILGN